MRQLGPPKLDAIKHPETRYMFKSLFDVVAQHAAILSKAVQLGQQPVANPTVPPGPDPASVSLPSPTLGTLLRGTGAGQWENLALGTDGQILAVNSSNARWVSLSTLFLPTTSGSNTWSGTNTFKDSGFSIYDDATPTKILAIQCSGLSVGTTTVSPPTVSTTLAGLGAAQTFTKAQTINPDSDAVPLKVQRTGGSASLFEAYSGSDQVFGVDSSGGAAYVNNPTYYLGVWGGDAWSFDSTSLTTSRTFTLPNLDGTLMLLNGTQTVNGTKTFSGANVHSSLSARAIASTASSGFSFYDTTDSSKRFRVVLSGQATGTNSALSFTGTASRTFTYPDYAGNVAVASDTPGGYEVLSTGSSGQELWQKIDHNHLSNRTRTVFYPAVLFYSVTAATSGVTNQEGAAPTAVAGHLTVNTADDDFLLYTKLPSDYVGPSTWIVHFATDSTSTGTAFWSMEFLTCSAGTTLTGASAGGTFSGSSAGTGTANQLRLATMASTISQAADANVRITVWRDGNNASDDMTGNVYFLGVELQYSADM